MATTKKKLTPWEALAESTHEGKQSIEHMGLWRYGKYTIRFRIKRDSYDFQSYAVSEVWSFPQMAWNEVGSVPYPHMKCVVNGSYYTQQGALWYATDVEALKRLVELTLREPS